MCYVIMSTTSIILVEKIRRFVVIKFVKLSDEHEINFLARLVKPVQKKFEKIRIRSFEIRRWIR